MVKPELHFFEVKIEVLAAHAVVALQLRLCIAPEVGARAERAPEIPDHPPGRSRDWAERADRLQDATAPWLTGPLPRGPAKTLGSLLSRRYSGQHQSPWPPWSRSSSTRTPGVEPDKFAEDLTELKRNYYVAPKK